MFPQFDTIICIPVAIILFILFGCLLAYLTNYKKRKIFKQIALKKNGKVKGILELKLNFTHKGCKVKVTGRPATGGSSQHGGSYSYPPKTEVVVLLRKNIGHEMIIKKKHFGHKIVKKLGVKYIKTGDEKFDNYCVVKGDEDFALKILNKKVIEKLLTGYPAMFKFKEKSILVESKGFYDLIILEGKSLLVRREEFSKTEEFFNFQINKATTIIDRLVELEFI